MHNIISLLQEQRNVQIIYRTDFNNKKPPPICCKCILIDFFLKISKLRQIHIISGNIIEKMFSKLGQALILVAIARRVSPIVSFHSNYCIVQMNTTNDFFLTSLDFSDSHIMSLGSAINPPVSSVIQINTFLKIDFPFNITYRIRTHQTNEEFNSSDKFIIFNPVEALIYTQRFKQISPLYNVSLSRIIDCCFGSLITDSFVLIRSTNLNPNLTSYELKYFQGTLLINSTIFSEASNIDFDKMIFRNGKVYILLQKKLAIFSGNSSLILLKNISLGYLTVNQMDITSSNGGYYGYSENKTIHLLNTTDLSQIWSISLNSTVIGIQIVSFYIFATTATQIYQIDFEAKSVISSTVQNESGTFLIEYCGRKNMLYLFKRENETNLYISQYTFTDYYFQTNGSCFATYEYINLKSQCKKIYPGANATNNTGNSTNGSTMTNTANGSTSNSSSSIMSENKQNKRQDSSLASFLNTTTMATATDLVGKCMSFTSMRITPSFLLSFTGFLDDLWYYKYHRFNYPQSVQFFMAQVDIMNDLRLNPWFLNFIEFLTKPIFGISSNQLQYQYMAFKQNDPQGVYFLHSAEDTYKNNLIMNIFFLLVLRLVLFLLTKIDQIIITYNGKSISWLKQVVISLKNNTHWWILINSVLQMNMLKLTFDCFIQILQPSMFDYENKLNLLLSILLLLALLFYCLCYYPLVYSFNSHRVSSILLTKSHYGLSSFYFECTFVVSRNFIRSLIHSLFIRNYSLQIILLSSIDVIVLILGIVMFERFKYRIIGVLCLLYSFIFLGFDAFFAILDHSSSQYIKNVDRQLIAFILALSLAVVALTTSIVLMVIQLYYLFKALYKKIVKNKIQNSDITRLKIKQKQKQSVCDEKQNDPITRYPFIRGKSIIKVSYLNKKSSINMRMQQNQISKSKLELNTLNKSERKQQMKNYDKDENEFEKTYRKKMMKQEGPNCSFKENNQFKIKFNLIQNTLTSEKHNAQISTANHKLKQKPNQQISLLHKTSLNTQLAINIFNGDQRQNSAINKSDKNFRPNNILIRIKEKNNINESSHEKKPRKIVKQDKRILNKNKGHLITQNLKQDSQYKNDTIKSEQKEGQNLRDLAAPSAVQF